MNECPDKMYYIVSSDKPFVRAAEDLEVSVRTLGFSVMHTHDLGATLRAKKIPFVEQCKVLEVCNPTAAARLLSVDMRLNMVVPCRISVFTEHGRTRIGMIRPASLLAPLSQDPGLLRTTDEVESKLIDIISAARCCR